MINAMQRKPLLLTSKTCLLLILLVMSFSALAQERKMNVTLGPEVVFGRQVSDIIPQLAGASRTNQDGRIGGEMVFWGHILADGSEAFLFACSLQKGVDCQKRTLAICPASPGELVASVTEPGNVWHLECRSVANVGIGDLRPGCTDNVETNDILVGLLQCSAQ